MLYLFLAFLKNNFFHYLLLFLQYYFVKYGGQHLFVQRRGVASGFVDMATDALPNDIVIGGRVGREWHIGVTAFTAEYQSGKWKRGMAAATKTWPPTQHLLVYCFSDNRLMTILHIVLRQLSGVLFHLLGTKINTVSFLHQRCAIIFFVMENATHSSSFPYFHAPRGGDAGFGQ